MSSATAPGASGASPSFDEDALRKKIPQRYARGTTEYALYEKLISALRARRPSDKPRILVITDIEMDYDDLIAIIFLSEMHRLGAVELAGFITNFDHPLERARFLRTILHLLNLGHIEVARGTMGREKGPQQPCGFYELKNRTFDNQEWNDKPFCNGADLIERLAREVDQGKEPLTVLLISSLQDISDFFKTHEGETTFMKKYFKKFVSQGGYSIEHPAPGKHTLEPTANAANNGWHMTAARNYTESLVRYELPSDAWSREVAKVATLDGGAMIESAQYGPIGTHLNWVYRRQEFKFFWDPFNAPYIPRLNPEWYLQTRLVMDPESEIFQRFKANPPDFQTVLPLTKVVAYDGCAAMGAVGDDVMRALGIMDEDEKLPSYNREAHQHRVFGRALNDLGGINGAKMKQALRTFLFGALMATHDDAEKLIPSSKVEHQMETYENVSLEVFMKQIPYFREKRILDEQARSKDETESAEAQRKLERLKKEMLPKPFDKFPKVPQEIPYELMYQDAIKGIQY